MKINILDDGIHRKTGHHFDYARKLLTHLAQTGHDVHVYGHADMHDEIVQQWRGLGKITRLFKLFPRILPASFDFYAGEMVKFERQSEALAADLAQVADADLWIWPSLLPQHLQACARLGVKTPIAGCIHEDPGIEHGSTRAMQWRVALLSAHGLRLTLGTVEPEIRHRFMPIIPSGRFSIIPHPYDGPPIAKPKVKLERIGFFGHQRPEKGRGLMGPLLQRVLGDGYRAVFHDTREQADLKHPNLEVLNFVDDIAEPIARCDLIVLPYTVDQYKAKGSGILAQCMALGVPVVGPFGTVPGRTIEQHGIGPLFAQMTPDSIYDAIKLADRNFKAYAANALNVARQFVTRNGTARYADAFLAGA